MNLLDLAVVIRAEDRASSAIQRASGNATSSFSSVAKGAAVFSAVQQVATAAFNAIASSVDNAVSRVDTLNQFPKIMQNLGIDSEAAKASIQALSDGIEGLPTTLDAAASGVTRFVSKNSDIKKSTEYFLAMNDAIVAGGASTEIQSSAVEQLSQAYAKGKMDMVEWRSLQTAMPAQLNQVAAAMGITTDALGEGLRTGEIAMDEFMDAIVQLDSEGVNGLASFHDQAQAATGGIGTSFTNMKTAIVKNVANVIDALNGSNGNITGLFNGAKSAINGFGSFIVANVPTITTGIAAIAGAFAALQVVGLVSNFSAVIGKIASAMSALFGVLAGNPIGIVVVAVAALVAGFITLYNTSEGFRSAVQPGIESVKTAFTGLVQTVSPLIQQLVSSVLPSLQQGFTAVLPLIEAGWNNLMLVISTVLNVISGLITFVTALMQGDWETAMAAIQSIGESVWNMLATIFQTAASLLGSVVSGLVSAIVGFFMGLWSSVTATASSIWDNVCSAFSSGVDSAVSFVSSLPDRILSIFSSVGSWLVDSGQSLIQGFVEGIMGAIDWAAGSVSDALSSLRALFPFSPAKEGPFSGRGWTLYSGISIAESIGEGFSGQMERTISDARREMASLNSAFGIEGTMGVSSNAAYSASNGRIYNITMNVTADSTTTLESLIRQAERAGMAYGR